MRRSLFAALMLAGCSHGKADTGLLSADGDGDGYEAREDCNDDNAGVFPGAAEICNGIDDDCDGFADDDDPDLVGDLSLQPDADADGYGSSDPADARGFCEPQDGWLDDASDCDDGSDAVYPGAQEYCNQRDDDCDGEIDEEGALDSPWYLDEDADGWGSSGSSVVQCEQPSGYVLDDGDCDDADPLVHPGAAESCNGIDDDCDGTVDEDATDEATWYLDSDGDGYGLDTVTLVQCEQPSGYVLGSGDCDDGAASIHPGASESCNDADDDCDGSVDEGPPSDAGSWYEDSDGDGYGQLGTSTTSCDQPSGHVSNNSDCDDDDAAVSPAATETCDGVDNDCDGTTDPSGTATFVTSKGSVRDVTSLLATGSSTAAYSASITDDGTLTLCPGTYYVHFSVSAGDLVVTGRAGSGSTVVQGDGSDSLVSAWPSSSSISLQGLTLRGGMADQGGGINGGDHGLVLVLDDLLIESSSASYGGGLYLVDGELVLQDVVIDSNCADQSGGGAYLSDTVIEGSGVEFLDNTASHNGAGAMLYDCSAVLDAISFHSNEAGSYGGGLYVYDGEADLEDAAFTGNVGDYAGGAIVNGGGISLVDSEISSNLAVIAGGGLYVTSGIAWLQDSSVHANEAAGYMTTLGVGGGLFLNNGAELSCTGSSTTTAGIYDNDATWAGGAMFYSDDVVLESDSCDWGTGSTDNSNYDIAWYSDYGAGYSDYGDDESFTCSGAVCY